MCIDTVHCQIVRSLPTSFVINFANWVSEPDCTCCEPKQQELLLVSDFPNQAKKLGLVHTICAKKHFTLHIILINMAVQLQLCNHLFGLGLTWTFCV